MINEININTTRMLQERNYMYSTLTSPCCDQDIGSKSYLSINDWKQLLQYISILVICTLFPGYSLSHVIPNFFVLNFTISFWIIQFVFKLSFVTIILYKTCFLSLFSFFSFHVALLHTILSPAFLFSLTFNFKLFLTL